MELYNKYRPKKFTEVIGQPYATGIGRSIASGDELTSVILSGPKGTGKTSLARIIGAALNCDFVDENTGDPCGECESCEAIFSRRGNDVIELNAADNSSIHDAREMIKSVSVGIPRKTKVLIIDEAQRLSNEAKSAFLNVTEYPIDNVAIIMTTTDLSSIHAANRSRMSIGDLKPLSDSDVKTVLDNVIHGEAGEDTRWDDITSDDIESIIAVSEGSAREALSRLSDRVYRGVKFTAGSGVTTKIVDSIVDGRFGDVIREVGDSVDNGVDAISLVDNIAVIFANRAASGDDDAILFLREVMNVRNAVATSSLAGRVAQAGLGAVAAPNMGASDDSAVNSRIARLEKKIDVLLDREPEWPRADIPKEEPRGDSRGANGSHLEATRDRAGEESDRNDDRSTEKASRASAPVDDSSDAKHEEPEVFRVDDSLSPAENAKAMAEFIKNTEKFPKVIDAIRSKDIKIRNSGSGPKLYITKNARIPKGNIILLNKFIPGRVMSE